MTHLLMDSGATRARLLLPVILGVALFLCSLALHAVPLVAGLPVSEDGINNWLNYPSMSRAVAVADNGDIYVVYSGDLGIRVVHSYNGGLSFAPSVPVTPVDSYPEIAVDADGMVYVAWVDTILDKIMFSRSSDRGQSFSLPIEVGDPEAYTVHLATDAPQVYLVQPYSGTCYHNATSGVGPFEKTVQALGPLYVDVVADPDTHELYLGMDASQLGYQVSTDYGQTFGPLILPDAWALYSTYALSKGSFAKYLLAAGMGGQGYRIDPATGVATPMGVGVCLNAGSRALATDRAGNVVDGYATLTDSFFHVSLDQGSTFNPPVPIAAGALVFSLAIDPRTGHVVVAYELGARIYVSVYDEGLPVANAAPTAVALVNGAESATVEQATADGTTVTLDGSLSSDPDGGALTYAWDLDSDGDVDSTAATLAATYNLGTHTATLTVTDPNGSTATDSVTITVQDTTAPVITQVTASPRVLWPPDGRMVEVTVNVAATDICDVSPATQIVEVTGNEAIAGDWEITGNLTVKLRAARTGATGRVYTLHVQTVDASGNLATSTLTITVPAILVADVSALRYSSTTLQATLCGLNGAPLAGRGLTFYVDNVRVGTARTDAAGVARLGYRVNAKPAGAYPIRVEFAGDSALPACSGTGTLIVQERTPVALIVTLASAGGINPYHADVAAGGTLTLRAMAQDATGYLWDASAEVLWDDHGADGTFTGSTYTAGTPGEVAIIATLGGVTSNAFGVTVLPTTAPKPKGLLR